jgi:hypothetical protein
MPEGESGQLSANVPAVANSGTPIGAGGYHKGGRVKKTGVAKLHKGEVVVRKLSRKKNRR